VINNSAVDVTVSVLLSGEGDANFIDFDQNDATTIGDVEADTNNNVLLYAVPSSVNIPTAETSYAASTKGYIIDDNGITLKFVLDAAEYQVKNTSGTYTATPKAGTGSGTAIQLGGYVNTKANWSEFAGAEPDKEVGVNAVFSYVKATTGESADPGIAGVYGLLSTPTPASLEVTPAVVAPLGFIGEDDPTVKSVVKTSITGTEYVVNFNFGNETLKKIAFSSGTVMSASDYVVDRDAGTITFSTSRTTALKGVTAVTNFIITLSDDSTYTLTVRPS
jgi:hypothetical protein